VRILYAGVVCPHPVPTAEPLQVVPADVLVLGATYGRPRFHFPPVEEAVEALLRTVHGALRQGATPVLLCSALGKAQDLLAWLRDSGLPLRAHRDIFRFTQAYRRLGVSLPLTRRFAGTPGHGEVVLWPMTLRSSPAVTRLRRPHFVLVSGLAQDELARRRLRVDSGIPLSNHADHDELLSFAKQVGAKEICLSAGQCQPLAKELRRRGLRVTALRLPRQMDLFAPAQHANHAQPRNHANRNHANQP
jgi:putative mRNA 3-end processing factor